MTVAEGRRELYRELVLDAAEREFARTGFAETRVTAIARAADLSLATVYKTFPGKTEIWNELHETRMTALLGEVERTTAEAHTSLERLLAGIGAVATFLTQHDAYLELSLGAGTDWLTPGGGHGSQATVWSAGLDTIAAGLTAARTAGELADLRPRVAAGLTVSALQVWLADWVESGRERPGAEVVDELVAHLRAVLGA